MRVLVTIYLCRLERLLRVIFILLCKSQSIFMWIGFLFYISKGALTYQNGIVLNSKIRVIIQYTYFAF